MISKPRRSVLAMPGSNARALEKGKTLPADVLMFELEDGVAESAKEAAREQVAAAVKGGGYGAREIVVRVNACDSPGTAAISPPSPRPGPDAIVIPKVNSPRRHSQAAADIVAAGAPSNARSGR